MSDKIKEDFGIQVNQIPVRFMHENIYRKEGRAQFDLCIISHNTTM